MTCSCAPSLIVARDELNVRFPKRDKSSDGCCASAKHTTQNPKSDHEPRVNGFATAYDFDEDVAEGLGTQELLALKALFLKDNRCKYVIYEARIAYPDGTDKPYKGANPHDKHLHLSIKPDAVHDTRPWGIARAFDKVAAAGSGTPTPFEEDDMPIRLVVYSDKGGNKHAHSLFGITAKYLDAASLNAATKHGMTLEDNGGQGFGAEFQGGVIFVDGPLQNVGKD